ncbi:hypothetical protein GALL_121740 [mine drainage metagenome]|uniref:Uncharacterized protein n=1 Tax=mine drainage metagenome TaxID=410659 RepID=A0A1J5SCQ9_9ZZZZ
MLQLPVVEVEALQLVLQPVSRQQALAQVQAVQYKPGRFVVLQVQQLVQVAEYKQAVVVQFLPVLQQAEHKPVAAQYKFFAADFLLYAEQVEVQYRLLVLQPEQMQELFLLFYRQYIATHLF